MVLLRSPLSAGFLALILGAGIWALATVRFETELLPILPSSSPSVRGLNEYARLAAGEDEIYVVPNPELPESDRANLLAMIRPALAAVPGVRQVTAPGEILSENAGTFAAWILLQSPPKFFRQVTEAFASDEASGRLAQIPARLAGAVDPSEIVKLQFDPLGLLDGFNDIDAGIAERNPTNFLIVSPECPLPDMDHDQRMTDAVQDALTTALGVSGRGKALLTGVPVFNTEISRQMRRDMLFMVVAAVALLVCTFYAFYRTLQPLRWIMFFQVLSILCGIVVARIIYGGLNLITTGFASILLGVGMDYSILVYHHWGSPHRNDMEVWHTLRRGIWFSAAVTSSAFFVLAFSSFPALQQLSILVGVGLLTTALFATWLLRNVLQANPPEAPAVLFRASKRSASWILCHRSLLLCLATMALAALAFAQPWNHLSSLYQADLQNLKPFSSSAYRAQEWLTQLDPSATEAIYIVRAPSYDAIRSAVEKMVLEIGANPSALSWRIPSESNSAANLMAWPAGTAANLERVFNEAGLGEEWSKPTLQVAQSLELAKSDPDNAFASVQILLKTLAGRDHEGAFAIVRVPGLAESPVPAGGFTGLEDDVKVLPVSWISLTTEVTKIAQRDFKYLGIAMLAAIVLLCAVAQRSLRMVALNLTALFLALAVFVALLLATGLRLTPLSLISLPLLVGLVVDYSLHILMALDHQRGDLHKTYDHIAAPVVLTGLSACIGFGAPMLTAQPALQNFGLVMDLGIISAVFACLVLLPVLYLLGHQVDYRDRKFYRALYRAKSFKLILLGWRLFGKHGAWLISRTVGLFYAFTHPATLRAVRANMALVDPARATFASACRLFINQAENFSTYGLLAQQRPAEVLDMLGDTGGLEYLQRAQEAGRGCLLVTGHLGFFELGGLVTAQMGFPTTALTLPEPAAGLTEWRAKFRARWGVKTVVVGDNSFSVIEIVKALRGGAFVASLADRPHDGNRAVVQLPHGTMPFSTGPALLALLAGCPIIPVAIVRQPNEKYRMKALGYIEPSWLANGRQATLDHYTREIAGALVPFFVDYVDQWLQFSPLQQSRCTSVAVTASLS
jgi:predicted exporter/lauroyl/myristoyl acyltransferase